MLPILDGLLENPRCWWCLHPCKLAETGANGKYPPWSSGAGIRGPNLTGPLPQEEWAFRMKNELVGISQPPCLSLSGTCITPSPH